MNPVLLLTVLQHLTERLLLRSPLANASLSVATLLFFLRIAEHPGISRIAIERELGIGSCSGDQSVKWLTKAGLVHASLAADRKTKELRLTQLGEEILADLGDFTAATDRPDDVFRVPSSMKRRIPTEQPA